MSQAAAQTASSATDGPALVVTTNVQKYAIKKKKVLNAEETELFELTQAAGVTVDQEVFKIIVDLLKMNVAPQAVFQTLKSMCAGQRVADSGSSSADPTSTSHTSSAVPAESREDETLVSSKSSKPAAQPLASCQQRTPRLNPKPVTYGAPDTNPAHPAVRSKPSAALGEKPRETSVQRVQRQPSATRGPKTKSSGSSSSSSQINST